MLHAHLLAVYGNEIFGFELFLAEFQNISDLEDIPEHLLRRVERHCAQIGRAHLQAV